MNNRKLNLASVLILFGLPWLVLIPFHTSGTRKSEKTIELRGKAFASSAQLSSQDLPNVFVMAPRDVRRPLTLAEEALAEENYAEAVNLLGGVLSGTGSEDYFLPPEEGAGTLTSVKNRALEMIGNLPPRGREIYQLRFGIEAEAILGDAIKAQDFDTVSQVAQRFFHTAAGYEAMVLLGRHHLDHGRYLQAARCFISVNDATDGDHPLHTEASLLASMSLVLSGRAAEARDVLSQLAQDLRRPEIEAGGQSISLRSDSPEAIQQSFEQLAAMIGTLPPSATTDALTQWCMLGGGTERNAVGAGGVPLLKPLWRVPVNDADDEEAVQLVAREFDDEKLAAFPGVLPLAVNDFVIMRTPNKVIGVDIRSGKRKWLYPWDDDFFGIAPNQSVNSIIGTNARQQQLKQRLWEDAIYGRMSSNGRSVYFVDGLGYATANRISSLQDPGALGFAGQVRVKAFTSREVNHLVALDLTDDQGRPIEGKLAWRVGDLDGLDEPALADTFFLGPPLPLDGRLYSLVESKGEIQLVVLDERTGALDWSQQLAIVEEIGGVQISAMRRLAGASPSYGEGLLICPTAAGAIVAVDPATRSLVWGYQFPTRARRTGSTIASNSFQNESLRPGEKWFDGSIVVADGHVLFSPVEATSLYCLELKTGRLVWEKPISREDGIAIAGVRDGTAFVMGGTSIKAINVDDGSITWRLNLSDYGRPSGRGYLDENSLCFPTVDRLLLQVNLDDGEVTRQVQCERVLGNLISVKGRIVSHGHDYVATYFQDMAAREEANRLFAIDSEDSRGLALQGQLLLLDGEWEAAVDALSRCYAGQVSDENAELLITCLLKGLRDNEPRALELIGPFEELVLSSTSRAQFLQLQVERLVELRQFDQAFEHLLALLFEDPDAPVDFTLEQINRDGRYVRQDRWVQTVMDRIMSYAAEEQLEAIEGRLSELETQLLANQDIQPLQRYDQMFGAVRPSAIVDLRLSRRAFEADETLVAMSGFHRLKDHEQAEIAGVAIAGLAKGYAKSQFHKAAAHYSQVLAEQFADVACWGDLSGKEVADEIFASLPPEIVTNAEADWHVGEIAVNEAGDFIGATVFPLEYFMVHQKQSEHDGFFPLTVDHDRKNEAVIRDRFGNEIVSIPMRQNSGTPPYYGSTVLTSNYLRKNELMILVSGYDLIAVDLTQIHAGSGAAVRWRHSLLPDLLIDPSNRTNKQRVSKKGYIGPLGWNVQFAVDTSFQRLGAISPISDRGLCYLKRNQLICIDPHSGEILWKHSDLQHGADILGDDEHIVVVDRSYSQSRVFRLSDGEEVAIRDLEAGRNALATYKTSLLSFDSSGTELRLRLTDVVTGETTWDESFAVGTRAAPVDDQTFAILQSDGALSLHSMKDGEVLLRMSVDPDDRVKSFRVIERPDQILVATNRNESAKSSAQLTGGRNTKVFIPNQMGDLVHGKLYAFNPVDGQEVWNSSAWIEQFCLPFRITPSVPILPLVRHHPARTERGSVAQTHTELAVIDLRDGRLLVHRDDIPQTTRMLHLQGDLDDQTAIVSLDEKRFEFAFSEEPRPAALPADTRFELELDEEDSQE